MKSIYLRNFTATAVLVLTCFLLVAFSCVSIGRIYLIREYKSTMENSAQACLDELLAQKCDGIVVCQGLMASAALATSWALFSMVLLYSRIR